MFFFTPKTIETRKSAVNGEIKVVKLLGAYSLVVGNYTQSGGLVSTIWDKALKNIKAEIANPEPQVLLLGLGAGTSARLVNRYFPKARLTGVELDPVVITLAKKYFHFQDLNNLTLVIGDAVKLVKNYSETKKKFDLILVDLYLGNSPAPGTVTFEFFSGLKKLLRRRGIAIFNQLIIKGQPGQAQEFRQKLASVFPGFTKIKTPVNNLYKVQPVS